MATNAAGETSGTDFSQEIVGGKRLPEDELWDVLTANLRQVMESTGAAMRILDTTFNVVVENEQMKELGGVDAEGSDTISCYDQFCNPEVCGTEHCTLKQIASVVEAASDGVAEVADATDDQAASTEEIASMVDETAEEFEHVVDESESIAAATEQQNAKIQEISAEVDELNALDIQSEL
ncbi:MAG: hypothetical protein ABEK02_04460 [Haloquadratum sp.]